MNLLKKEILFPKTRIVKVVLSISITFSAVFLFGDVEGWILLSVYTFLMPIIIPCSLVWLAIEFIDKYIKEKKGVVSNVQEKIKVESILKFILIILFLLSISEFLSAYLNS